jgi:hypothetical protein
VPRPSNKDKLLKAAGGGGGGNVPISRELAFADTAATGVSPALLAGTTSALGGGVLAANLAGTSFFSSVARAAMEAVILSLIRKDVEVSVDGSLQGVNWHHMRDHKHGERFRAIELFAWTNSGVDIFVNTDTDNYFAALKQLQQNRKLSVDESVLYMRGFTAVVVYHELVHIEQFRQTGKPTTFKQMLNYERDAYGCDAASAPAAASPRWLNQQGQGGARDFLVNKLLLNAEDAVHIIDSLHDSFTGNCVKLSSLNVLAQDQQIKDGFIDNKFLPEELVPGQGRGYQIGDLYKT